MRRYSGACVVLVVGLSLAGCGGSSNGKSDAGRDGGGGNDARSEAGTNDAGNHDAPLGVDGGLLADAGIDEAAGDAAVVLDGAEDRAGDAGDAGRDVPEDASIVDGSSLDGGTGGIVDASLIDGGVIDGGLSETGGMDAATFTALVASLSGTQEVPPVASNATGSATFVLSADGTQLTYQLVHTVANPTGAELHLAAAGETAPAVYPLSPVAATMSGVITLNPGDADSLQAGMFYVNVSSQAFPTGEIRGQITQPGASVWVANLTGSQETPPVSSGATAHAAVILDASKSMIHYHVTSTLTNATASHIHKAVAAVPGSVIYPLSPVGTSMDGTIAITALDATDLMEGRWYINIHTPANPNGEIRGQLIMPGEVLYSASLAGANEVPPVSSNASGGAQFILSPSGTSMRYEAAITGVSPTSADVNNGAVGSNGPVVFPLTFSTSGIKGTLTVSAIDVSNFNLGNYYVNVETATNPSGELRGQITMP